MLTTSREFRFQPNLYAQFGFQFLFRCRDISTLSVSAETDKRFRSTFRHNSLTHRKKAEKMCTYPQLSLGLSAYEQETVKMYMSPKLQYCNSKQHQNSFSNIEKNCKNVHDSLMHHFSTIEKHCRM